MLFNIRALSLTTFSFLYLTGVPQKLTSAWMEYNRCSEKPIDIIITATECNQNTEDDNLTQKVVQIISYPEGVLYTLPVDSDFNAFFKNSIMREDQSLISNQIVEREEGGLDDAKLETSTGSFNLPLLSMEDSSLLMPIPTYVPKVRNVPWKYLILVCVHASRDNRCGRAGPQIIEEFNNQINLRSIPKGEIEVTGSSHIGGHKYAGVLVVYPQGDWYGLISKRNVGDLLDNIINNTKYLKGWRGNESLSW